MNVPLAWQATTGSSSQKMAIIAMGGVNENHEDLASRVTIKTSAASPLANAGAADPEAGIMGAATNNGKGIAGVNWAASLLSYNISEAMTKTVQVPPNNYPMTKTYVGLNESAVAPAINGAVNAGAKTILLPLNWVQKNHIPNITLPNLQFYPCCKVINTLSVIFTDVLKIGKSIISSLKTDHNFSSSINAVKNAYLDGSVMVGKALEYNGTGIGFPANLASDHVIFTVGGYDTANQLPFQYSGTPEGDDTSYDPNDINVIAPGVDLETTLTGNQEYGTVSGTGASAALGAGIVSLLQAADPSLTPDDITHVLQKTAAPVGGGGYNDQSGYGIINAGAAMDYVQNHDIKHGTITNGQIQEIDSGREITLFSSVWKEVAAGTYFADIDQVTFTIPLIPSASNDLWVNAGGTLGWSYANPNSQNRYAHVELFSDHATVTMYIYNLTTIGGASAGWHPVNPSNIKLNYSYVGEVQTPALSVSISGPDYANRGESQSFSSSVQYAEGLISYQWYYQTHPNGGWFEDSGATGSSYTHLFDYPDGTTSFINQAVKVVVTSNGETASDVQSVKVIDCDEEHHALAFKPLAPCR